MVCSVRVMQVFRNTLFLLALFLTGALSAQIPIGGLVGHFPLNNETGDRSGNGNNAEMRGDVTTVPDRFGNPCGAMEFNGTDGYLVVYNSPSLKSTANGITVSAWFKPYKSKNGSNDINLVLLSKSGDADKKAQFRLSIKRTFGDSRSEISLSSDFTGYDNSYMSHPISFDEWHFIAFTFEDEFIYLYLDGKLIWQAVNSRPFTANDADLEIGRDVTDKPRYFYGAMDDIRIYKRALSRIELLNLYEDLSSKNQKSDVVMQLPPDITKPADPNKCSTRVEYDQPAVSTTCGTAEVKQIGGLPSGSEFPLGRNTIVFETITSTGGRYIDSFAINVIDKEPPLVSCPGDTVVERSEKENFARLELPKPGVSDNCGIGKVKIVTHAPDDYIFPFGKTEVIYEAFDAADNHDECSFIVTVVDPSKPVYHCTQDVTLYTLPDSKDAIAAYDIPYGELKDRKTSLQLLKGPKPGAPVSVGKTEVVFESKDQTQCKFIITVKDTIPPVIKCPESVKRTADYGKNNMVVNYSLPLATDGGSEIPVRIVSGMESGKVFPVGATPVVYEAKDESGNATQCSFTVIVSESDIQPEIKCNQNITAYAPSGKSAALVNYTTPYIETGGHIAPMKLAMGKESGSYFNIGTTEVLYVDDKKVCQFTVTVKDTSGPVFVCNEPLKITCPYGQKSVAVTYPIPTATDLGKQVEVKMASGIANGGNFPIGTTEVKYTATDEYGNQSACVFKVIVAEDQQVIKKPLAEKPKPAKEDAMPAPVAKEDVKPKEEETRSEKMDRALKAATETFGVESSRKPTEEKVPDAKQPERAKPVEAKAEPVKPAEPAVTPPAPVTPPSTPTAKAPKPEKEPKKKETAEAPKPKNTAPSKPVKGPKPLQLTCNENITKNTDRGRCGSIISYPVPEATGGSEPKVLQTRGSRPGQFFPVGTTTNVFDATDALGTKQQCSFTVTVRDLEPPVFSCPRDTTILLPVGRRGLIYHYTDPQVSDNCSLDSVILVSGSKSGCFLQVGVHPFVYKVTDAAGNYTNCTYSVMVKEDDRVVMQKAPPTELDAALELGDDSVNYQFTGKVNDCFVTVLIYDDGEEDDDSVSIIFNNQVIVNRSKIRIKENGAIVRNLYLDDKSENYLIAKAWNTGKYGLNTLKLEVYEGNVEDEKKELRNKKPVLTKVLHSKPGVAGGMLLRCGN